MVKEILIFIVKWGMSWGIEVEGVVKWCSISIIFYCCVVVVWIFYIVIFVKVSNVWIFVGVEFIWRVDRFDEEFGCLIVIVG